jgi:hypothetical protein
MSRSAPVHSTRRSPTIMRASKTSVRMPDEPTGLKRIFNKAQKYLAGMSPLEVRCARQHVRLRALCACMLSGP